MGLFNSRKEEEAPMPPAPSASPNAGAMPAPPSPEAPPMPSAPETPVAPDASGGEVQVPDFPSGASLSPPPMPGGSLDDIKQQVVGDEFSSPEPSDEAPIEFSTDVAPTESKSSISSNEDLFNMFNVDSSGEEDSNFDDVVSSSTSYDESSEPIVTSMDNLGHEELGYVSKKVKRGDSSFLTTTQFKALLEVVDSVKNKVKDSSETHLRLMDMKAEEDIEYENLRKSFQFIEDRLYELDGILFEK